MHFGGGVEPAGPDPSEHGHGLPGHQSTTSPQPSLLPFCLLLPERLTDCWTPRELRGQDLLGQLPVARGGL